MARQAKYRKRSRETAYHFITMEDLMSRTHSRCFLLPGNDTAYHQRMGFKNVHKVALQWELYVSELRATEDGALEAPCKFT